MARKKFAPEAVYASFGLNRTDVMKLVQEKARLVGLKETFTRPGDQPEMDWRIGWMFNGRKKTAALAQQKSVNLRDIVATGIFTNIFAQFILGELPESLLSKDIAGLETQDFRSFASIQRITTVELRHLFASPLIVQMYREKQKPVAAASVSVTQRAPPAPPPPRARAIFDANFTLANRKP